MYLRTVNKASPWSLSHDLVPTAYPEHLFWKYSLNNGWRSFPFQSHATLSQWEYWYFDPTRAEGLTWSWQALVWGSFLVHVGETDLTSVHICVDIHDSLLCINKNKKTHTSAIYCSQQTDIHTDRQTDKDAKADSLFNMYACIHVITALPWSSDCTMLTRIWKGSGGLAL